MTVPAQGLLMVVSGSPCRQLTTACPTRGTVGLCGHDSYLVYAVTAVAWLAQHLRPDISLRVLNENVAAMRREHRGAMEVALGLRPWQQSTPVLNAVAWTACARSRIFMSTLPAGTLIPDTAG